MHNGRINFETVIAGADLSAARYKAVTYAGVIAAENDTAIGILWNVPAASGRHAQVATQGLMKGYAGAAITANARVKVTTSGFIIAVASGDGTGVGKAQVAANSGDLFAFYGDFANAHTVFNQT